MDMRNIALIFIVLLSAVTTILGLEDWKECPYKYWRYSTEHSYCLSNCCSCTYYEKGVSDDLKNRILSAYNSFRSKVASGYSPEESYFPTATNMLEMVWDNELAEIAQKFAYSCPENYDCDSCRMVERFQVGQIHVDSDGELHSNDLDRLFEHYYTGAHEHLSKEGTFNSNSGMGGYTELLWGNMWRIGCGYLYYNGSNGRPSSTLVCNYGPVENVVGEEVYKAGDTCSACPANTCCGDECKKHGIEAKYKGLCKVIDENKPPEGDVPHQKSGNEIFYCDFNGESDCSYSVEGIDWWIPTKDNGGSRLITLFGIGWTSTLHFTTPFKSQSRNMCIKIVTRKGSLQPGNVYNYHMEGTLKRADGDETVIVFPRVRKETEHKYQVDYFQPRNYPKGKDVRLSLTFHVPYGSREQYFEVHKIIAQDNKCKKTTAF